VNVVEFGQEHQDVILLLHGGGLSWWNYEEAAALLAKRFHVVLPLLDGHPGSERPFSSIESCAQAIINYIDQAFGGHVLLIGGLSLGGQVLMEILSQRSAICDAAVIESALALPMPFTAAWIRPALSLCYPLIRKRWFSKLQFLSLHIRPELFEQYYKDTRRLSQSDMIAFLEANAQYQPKETLRACKAKTLILVGSREQAIMKKSAKLLSSHIPAAQQRTLPGLRHGELSINHAKQYAELLERFIGP